MTNFESIKNIVYLEPKNSFSEMATEEFCKQQGLQCFTTSMSTISEIVEYVERNPDTLGMLPVENTLDGTIRESLDCLMNCYNQNIKIIAELILPIEYCLLSKTTEFYSITGLIATPRLIAKCHNFINSELPLNMNIIESPSMVEAAKELNNHNLTFASIGNRKIAQSYMLNVLKENIHDDKNNTTKYIVIGNLETEPTEKDRTTVVFQTNDTPGALLEILKIFLEHDINLSYIASRQSKTEPDKYIFIVNFDGHIKNTKMYEVIEQIKPRTAFFRYLGSYPACTYFQ